ncbi:hypothetical protein GW931_00110 [archaeon]|nr:hypothetical protein [archaeon]PJC45421.1 MAG: hypothetical protein CO037_01620 [Candidatus Pacearchaeota archaeon CG_4_9_14_0_2_um_filter_30_8]
MGIVKGFLETGKNLDRIILEMDEGEEGYAEPKFLDFDYELKGYLDRNGPISKQYDPINKRTLYVKKIGQGKDDYLVNISEVKGYAWISLSEEKVQDFLSEVGEEKIARLDYQPSLIFEEVQLEKDIEEAIENENFEKVIELKKKRDNTLKKNL